MASTGIQGAWQGTWESVRNGHQGQLKCVVRPTQDPNIFQFHYWATFWKVFRATYEVEKKVVASNGVWRIQGEKNLGRLAGGLYQYQGETDGQELRATYKSAGDEGVFLLSRPIAP